MNVVPTFGASDSPQRDIPLSRIEDMQRKGFTNNQIIQTLQRDGYSSSQVFDALNQSNMQPTTRMGPIGNPDPAPSPASDPEPMSPMPPPPSFSSQSESFPSGDPSLLGSSNEELIEAIIDEKWNELVKDINKIIEWKDAMTARIERFEQSLEDVKREFSQLHQAVVGKVGEYDKNILEVGAEVKAMEKVFSKVLPAFTQNIAELSKITDAFKGRE